jgi:hypothetical protein
MSRFAKINGICTETIVIGFQAARSRQVYPASVMSSRDAMIWLTLSCSTTHLMARHDYAQAPAFDSIPTQFQFTCLCWTSYKARSVVALVWCQPLNRRILPNPSVPSLYWVCMPVHSAACSRYPWAYNPHPGFMQTQGDGRVQSAWFNLNPCRTLLLWMFRQSHRDHAYRPKRWTMLFLAEPTKLSLSMRQGCLISSVKHKIALHYQHLIHARPHCLTWSYRKQKA